MKSSIFLTALLLVLLQSFTSAEKSVQEACKGTVEYDFCVSALASRSEKVSVDPKDFTALAVELTIESFKETKSKISNLKKNKGLTHEQQGALVICSESYTLSLSKFEDVLPLYKRGGFMAATNHLTAALDKTTSCIDAFIKTGIDSLLAKENDEAMHLVALTTSLMEES